MLDSAFNNLSISGWDKDEGNRPPALSASSLSSIGEDMSHRIDGFKGFNRNPQTSSPKSSGSTAVHYTSVSPNRQSHSSSVDTTRSFVSRHSEVDQLGSNANSDNPLPTLNHISAFDQFSEGSNTKTLNESRLFNWPEHRSFLPSDYDRNSQSNLSDPDTSIGGSNFGFWNSHQKFPSSMDSLYENEEFLGNRTRSFSSTPSLDFVHDKDVHSNRINTYSFPSSVTSTPDCSLLHQRQRVQSADAVHNNSLRNQIRHLETGSPMHHPDHMNRARSFSTGYTNVKIQSNHQQNWNHSYQEHLYQDPESHLGRNFEVSL